MKFILAAGPRADAQLFFQEGVEHGDLPDPHSFRLRGREGRIGGGLIPLLILRVALGQPEP